MEDNVGLCFVLPSKLQPSIDVTGRRHMECHFSAGYWDENVVCLSIRLSLRGAVHCG